MAEPFIEEYDKQSFDNWTIIVPANEYAEGL